MAETGTLYLVPTPIGNLEDMTFRAVTVLKEVDLIACEDTRRSGHLLAHFGIETRKISYFEHNELRRIPQIVAALQSGDSVAVVSDGGSPGLSDPAYRLVTAAIDASLRVEALPGANALIPALTASGLPTDRFFFEGFLPVKSARRKRRMAELASVPHTLVFYESVHRIVRTVKDMAEIYPGRRACIGREISKLHEEYIRGDTGEIAERIGNSKPKGEFVIVVEGNRNTQG